MSDAVNDPTSDSLNGPVQYELADGVASITLARPEAMNALDTATKDALKARVLEAAADPAVRAVLLAGSGRAFCVGQDLREHVDALAADPRATWQTVPEHYSPIVQALATMPKPVVAAVNGVAAGAGAAFAWACDLRIMAASAGFNTAFAAIGLSCDSGSSWTLPRLVGWARAKELLLMPRTVKAEEALALGLATEVVPDDAVLSRAREVAVQLAAGPTVAYGAIRRSLEFSAGHSLHDSLGFEGEMMALTGTTADHLAAVAAFNAKQKPVFDGR